MATTRNLPCPCGSGRKQKKCCQDKLAAAIPHGTARQPAALLTSRDSVDLLKTAAALSVLPENHGKAGRLEMLTREILRSFNHLKPSASRDELNQYLAAYYASHYLEDPATNLVTDLVPFYGGDFLIFPGLTEGGSFMLTNLVAAIFQGSATSLSVLFKVNCREVLGVMLGISDLLVRRLGYPRYQPGAVAEEALFLPATEVLEHLKAALVISPTELRSLLPGGPLPAWVLQAFTLTITEFQAAAEQIQESCLAQKPLLRLGDNYLVVSPLTMSYALTDFIWQQAKQWGCQQELREAYRQLLWHNVQAKLKQLGFAPEAAPAALLLAGLGARQGVYRFDTDKIALVELVSSPRLPRQLGEERPAVTEVLLTLPPYAGHCVLHLQLSAPEDGDLMLAMSTGSPQLKELIIPIEEFDVLCTRSDLDAIDLWKFTLARQARYLRTKHPLLCHSFLDEFKLYREHHDSFYVSDAVRADVLSIPMGYAADWLTSAKQAVDYHSATVKLNGRYATLPVQRMGKHAPVYCNIDDLASSRLRFLVAGFPQPVWVEPANLPARVSGQLRHWFYELNEALAYWLWQVQAGLAPFLAYPQLALVRVTYECHPLPRFAETQSDFTRVPNLARYFRSRATADTLTVVIPAELLPYLYGADNEGERALVQQLLLAFNQLLAANELPQMPDQHLEALLAQQAPLGQKKKIFLLDTSDNLLLDPRHLVPKRTVQDYDTSLVLDSLVPALEELGLCPPVGPLTTKTAKQQLTTNLVMHVLLPKLRSTAGRYNQRDLVLKLLALNESLIYHREHLRVTTPTRIACFVSEEQRVAELKENLTTTTHTSIAVRCLIEHLSAEQLNQGAYASTTDIDELVGLMDQVVTWGTLDDQLYYDLFDSPMGILATGRVGTGKALEQDVLAPYHTAKAQEDIFDAIKFYPQVFPQQHPSDGAEVPAFLDEAFRVDFGLTFTQLCEVINGLGILALHQEASVAVVPKTQLRARLADLGFAFDEANLEAALNLLSLVKRAEVATPPVGYEFQDIQPWRFSRRLSLLLRPVVAFDNPEAADNPTLYWGFRQLLTSRIYWAEQILADRLRVPKGGAMAKAMGTIRSEAGAPLVRKVAKRLAAPGLIVDTEVSIKPSGKLRHAADLGDVDVLIIHPGLKKVFSLECKNMAPSRNIKEMVEEVQKLLGAGSKKSKSWVAKHLVRHQWLIENRGKLGTAYGLDVSEFTIESLLITTEDMLTPYLKKQDLPIRFVTAYALERRGWDALTAPI